jgi:DNA topoisomerase-2
MDADPDAKRVRVEDVYQKKTHIEHILLRPDSYIGSVEEETDRLYVPREYGPSLKSKNKKVEKKQESAGVDDVEEEGAEAEVGDDLDQVDTSESPSPPQVEQRAEMEERDVTFVPGLFKIFDEILVNAADNRQRDPTMNLLAVAVNRETNSISVYNTGKGVPVEKHKEYNCYVPELVFCQLLTSSNFNDKEQKTTGGRNGYGAKLANIFSTEFTVETSDSERGLVYKQTFKDNMTVKGKAKIREFSDKQKAKATTGGTNSDWTRITFTPDWAKFGMVGLTDDTCLLLKKRVMDVAGTTPKDLVVKFNGERLKANTFKAYVEAYLPEIGGDGGGPKTKAKKVYTKVNERWEVCVAVSPEGSGFRHCSFVNNIWTMKGGRHVTIVADKVAADIANYISGGSSGGSDKKKNKKTSKSKPKTKKDTTQRLTVTSAQVKSHMLLFVNALITNPTFDSQTKVNLTSKQSAFGSKCDLDEAFFKKVRKCGLVDRVLASATALQDKAMKKNDGRKRGRLAGIPKLDDANEAGGRKAKDCTLILTEGDSAKALAVSGLGVVGRDLYGVFPLKGKLLNVRDASTKSIMNNAEITYLKQILGLKQGHVYTDTKSLRYGHVMLMTDQDQDGSHIKGLVLNLFATFWPSLLFLPGFLNEFITPIVRVTKAKRQARDFFTLPEYEAWKLTQPNEAKGWIIKYYKGLGTSTAQEAKRYFSDLVRHQIDFAQSADPAVDAKLFDMAFSKKKADARKTWITNHVPGTYLDMEDVSHVSYSDFINKELILFSIASNTRAIPHVLDGLKPGQRKILFACFKRKLFKELKVAQLAGYVSEHSAYHHGEMSLNSTIVGLAQTFLGSNNVNLLVPSGQFGTRLQKGKDAASTRYIFTYLSPITQTLFDERDKPCLDFLTDDGASIEPSYYLPIVPLVLVNGAAGIGTGYSTNVPSYNIRDLMFNLRGKLQDTPLKPLHPWYNGFTGSIKPIRKAEGPVTGYRVRGRLLLPSDADVVADKVNPLCLSITELPVDIATSDYKAILEAHLESGSLKDVREHHTDTTVHFEVTFANAAALTAAVATRGGGLWKFFKLEESLSITNMRLHGPDGKLKHYQTAAEILDDFFIVRLTGYVTRKKYLVAELLREIDKLRNKIRFIRAVVVDELKIRNVAKKQILDQLVAGKYAPIFAVPASGGRATEDSISISNVMDMDNDDANDKEEEQEEQEGADTNPVSTLVKGYDYLLSLSLWSLTAEKVQALAAMYTKKERDLHTLMETSPKALWLADLDTLEKALQIHEAQAADRVVEADALRRKVSGKVPKKNKSKKTKKLKRKAPEGGRESVVKKLKNEPKGNTDAEALGEP